MASFRVCFHAWVSKYLLNTYCTVGPHHRGGAPLLSWAVSCSVSATECLLDGRHGCGLWQTPLSSCAHPACSPAACTQKHWEVHFTELQSDRQSTWPFAAHHSFPEDSHAWSLPLSCSSLRIHVALSCMAATTCCLDLSVHTEQHVPSSSVQSSAPTLTGLCWQ